MARWRDQAACRPGTGVDSELFFPLTENRHHNPQMQAAKDVCARCPVRNECLDWAVRSGLPYGVAGGLTSDERTELRRAARAVTA